MFQPLWRDEGTTFLHASQHSIPAVLQSVHKGEWSPPLYFVIEYLWVRLAGTSEFILRLPSLVAVAVAIGLLYDTVRRVAGRLAGYATTACAFMTPLLLFLGAEARPYAMTLLLAALILRLVGLLLDDGRRDVIRIATILAVVVAALCWTHYTAWPVIVGLVLAAPAIPTSSNRRLLYLIAVLAGGATTAPLIHDFAFAARAIVNISPDLVGTDVFHRIDARLLWFNPLLIAEPVFIAFIFIGSALWLFRTVQSGRNGLTPENRLLIVCFSIVICGVSASVIRSVQTSHHLAPYAPAAWLIVGTFYARLAWWLGVRRDIRGLAPWRKGGLLALWAITMMTLAAFPVTYLYEAVPRSGSRALVRELRLRAADSTMLIAVPDALSPSLKYYLDQDPTARLHGIPTWSQPWYYGYVTTVDPSQKRLLLDRIESAIKRCTRVAFAVDWRWKTFNGIYYAVAHDIVREESRLHGVAFHRVFPGTIETMDLVVLTPSCPDGRQPRAIRPDVIR